MIIVHEAGLFCVLQSVVLWFCSGTVHWSSPVLPLQHVQSLLFRRRFFAEFLSQVLDDVFKQWRWWPACGDRSTVWWSRWCHSIYPSVFSRWLQKHSSRLDTLLSL